MISILAYIRITTLTEHGSYGTLGLLHASGRQRRSADHVSSCVDVLTGRSESHFIDGNHTSVRNFQPSSLKACIIILAHWVTTSGGEKQVSLHGASVIQLHLDVLVISTRRRHVGELLDGCGFANLDTGLSQQFHQHICNIHIHSKFLSGGLDVSSYQDGHILDSERVEDVGELDTDDSESRNGHRARQVSQKIDGVRVENAMALLKGNASKAGGLGSSGHKYLCSSNENVCVVYRADEVVLHGCLAHSNGTNSIFRIVKVVGELSKCCYVGRIFLPKQLRAALQVVHAVRLQSPALSFRVTHGQANDAVGDLLPDHIVVHRLCAHGLNIGAFRRVSKSLREESCWATEKQIQSVRQDSCLELGLVDEDSASAHLGRLDRARNARGAATDDNKIIELA
mmetsp:Transcript_7162/g.15146  ORF Transcript_7162/g.15146 Transcript_7162/m.15146 type:complete len:398 (-) Transcript_7162:344-1537(-)